MITRIKGNTLIEYNVDRLSMDSGTIDKRNKNGHFIRCYSNGFKESEGNYIDGKRNGYFESYYENGELKTQSFFKDGLLHGFSEVYSKKGESFWKGEYELGVKLKWS